MLICLECSVSMCPDNSSNYLIIFLTLFIHLKGRSIALINLKEVHETAHYRIGNIGVKRQTFREYYIFSFFNEKIFIRFYRSSNGKSLS